MAKEWSLSSKSIGYTMVMMVFFMISPLVLAVVHPDREEPKIAGPLDNKFPQTAPQ